MGKMSNSMRRLANDAERAARAMNSVQQGGKGAIYTSGNQTITFVTNIQSTATASGGRGGSRGGGGGTMLVDGQPIPPNSGPTASSGHGRGGSGHRVIVAEANTIAREILRQLGATTMERGAILVRTMGGG